jgi:hypothetical protein
MACIFQGLALLSQIIDAEADDNSTLSSLQLTLSDEQLQVGLAVAGTSLRSLCGTVKKMKKRNKK